MRKVAEDHEGQQRTYERRDGVIRARSCRAQYSLCVNVEKYAESVGNEADTKYGENAPKYRNTLS